MDLIYRVSAALRIISRSKRGIFSFFKSGASVASTQILHSVKQYLPSVKTILDVGANQGQFAIAACYFYPEAKIYSFEPVPDTFGILKKNIKDYGNVTIFDLALGSSTGRLEFYRNEYSHASSALPVSRLQKSVLPKTSKEHKISVEVKRLDDVFRQIKKEQPILLKLDVQGFEKEVLKGAQETLNEIDYLLFEASFVAMYDGEPLFDEMHSYVTSLGFELIAPVGFLQSDDLQILQMDMLYKNERRA